MKEELAGYDAIALGELVRQGEISPVELLDVTIQRIEEINPKLNAVIHMMFDQARDTAEAWQTAIGKDREPVPPFCGVPFLLKDLLAEYKGAPFNEGSRSLTGYVSRIDSELVKRQKASGLNIVGKTNTSEFGCLPMAASVLHGATVNPWDPSLSPGGSSGGSTGACPSLDEQKTAHSLKLPEESIPGRHASTRVAT
jgi:amidase